MERTNMKKNDKEVTHGGHDFGNLSAKKANETTQFQDWIEVNSKNRENANKLFYLSLLLNKIKGSTSYEDIRTVNGILYTTFEDAYNALLI
ncbi:hypothetical protein HID58_037691 [Brassica napus]|uniref:Uncharacterized protein n=1 Tax=Brassica napus TaxID=3708 RepID=A0ABQ8BM73_BRANA|nr:hypothetical protein HID58_037691 [Brassica napus]